VPALVSDDDNETPRREQVDETKKKRST
jgi:hypothetical protein